MHESRTTRARVSHAGRAASGSQYHILASTPEERWRMQTRIMPRTLNISGNGLQRASVQRQLGRQRPEVRITVGTNPGVVSQPGAARSLAVGVWCDGSLGVWLLLVPKRFGPGSVAAHGILG